MVKMRFFRSTFPPFGLVLFVRVTSNTLVTASHGTTSEAVSRLIQYDRIVLGLFFSSFVRLQTSRLVLISHAVC